MDNNDTVDLQEKKSFINMQKLLAPLALIIIYAFFSLFGRNFFSFTTLVNILDSSYYIGFIAIGVTFVIITGGIDLSCGTVMMCAAIIGGTAYKSWGWPMWLSLVLILSVGVAFGFFNGILISRLGLPPFIATLGTQMISLGTGSIVSNVRSATFPARGASDSWFKSIFKFITEDNASIPTGAIVLFLTAFIAYLLLNRTKMGRYIFAIGSNKDAARLSGVDVRKWEMMAYVVAGFTAGMGGIAFAAVYTTVMPAQGAGFELYAIAGAVIGGTSLSGGAGSVLGTMIGVYIMSVLRSGLPSMDLQAQYQTFFTGVVVIGAVLLDIYRNKKASEVRIQTPADQFREESLHEIDTLKQRLEKELSREEKTKIQQEIRQIRVNMKKTYARMRKEEKEQKARLALEEKEFEMTVRDEKS
ncbi:permease component of ribose/xylose/arabinose/galactoside ABC-type transporters [Sphaerochaeta pleomorpha str. Grapes]|uniref:Permease component of ribose/xylose/arabinose/galactoside ABC-type transporters n=1 Tax=Sphaerochaeta pleomorpha (strain ATCC BAA-1885 / DSM 22778 / Grapes) TaxID=158190 RepID=G8QV84_SPHPG|nr:ribose ABC transporter permease [Sphaerochaeta pleomorpha]AEV30399.1 permease component of ribose/xylose/arabinose/galactoside ABC-type transporters [Sphaerochaeta pleomorpha str. Grapes]